MSMTSSSWSYLAPVTHTPRRTLRTAVARLLAVWARLAGDVAQQRVDDDVHVAVDGALTEDGACLQADAARGAALLPHAHVPAARARKKQHKDVHVCQTRVKLCETNKLKTICVSSEIIRCTSVSICSTVKYEGRTIAHCDLQRWSDLLCVAWLCVTALFRVWTTEDVTETGIHPLTVAAALTRDVTRLLTWMWRHKMT